MAAPELDLDLLGAIAPSRQQRADVAFGWPLLRELERFGLRGALAVRERDVVAAQGEEPMAALIERAGSLCRGRRWTLLLAGGAPRPSEVAAMGRARGRCLGLAPAAADSPSRPELVAAADRAGVAVVIVR